MKQLNLFPADKNSNERESPALNPVHFKVFIDGASRNNPGPSGAGVFILKDAQLFEKHGFYLGKRTNNQAEYLALLLGLYLVKPHVHPTNLVHVVSDSQLLVRQLTGQYRIKNKELLPLFTLARTMLEQLKAHIFHVFRADNDEADAMANHGIDKKIPIPLEFIALLKKHEIQL